MPRSRPSGSEAARLPSRSFCFLSLANRQNSESAARYAVEVVSDDAIEHRLHDLTLDFGVTTATAISRPLQMKEIGALRLILWAMPRDLPSEVGAHAIQAFKQRRRSVGSRCSELRRSPRQQRGAKSRLGWLKPTPTCERMRIIWWVVTSSGGRKGRRLIGRRFSPGSAHGCCAKDLARLICRLAVPQARFFDLVASAQGKFPADCLG